MKVLIIEDEEPAYERLRKLIRQADPSIEVCGHTVSIASTVQWLRENPQPDLLFLDIQLADGSSFEIFKAVNITCPVIFTTAYDQFAIEAFKLNSIDYLLKPLKKNEVENAISKFRRLFEDKSSPPADYTRLIEALGTTKKEYQKRIVIRFGETIKIVEIGDIAYFYTQDKINFLCTDKKVTYPVDYTLDELEGLLDNTVFYRINRQFIVNVHAIEKLYVISKSRVKLVLKPPFPSDVVVSTERSGDFKKWLSGR